MDEVLDTTSYQWPKWSWKKVDAVNDTAATNEDSSVTINVLSNDKNATGIYKIFDDNKISDVSLTDSALTDSYVAAEDYTTSLYPKPYTITLDSDAKVTLLGDNTVTYDPNGQFNDLKDGQSEYDSFSYAAYGRYGTDTATVSITITGVSGDEEPPTGNQAPVAFNDTAYIYNYPYPEPYPYPLPETEAQTTSGETTAVEADLSDDLIYTTLALGEEGDPDLYPNDVYIDVPANDKDANGDSLHVATIAGEKVDADPDTDLPAAVTLGSGATVTLNGDGTLFYNGVDYYSPDPLATEGDTTVTASGDADALVFWEGYPIDRFTYQAADDEGALSNEATVNIFRSPIYYYDTAADPVLDTSADVGDPSLAIA